MLVISDQRGSHACLILVGVKLGPADAAGSCRNLALPPRGGLPVATRLVLQSRRVRLFTMIQPTAPGPFLGKPH